MLSPKRPERQIRRLLLATALPGIAGTAALLWRSDLPIQTQAVVFSLVTGASLVIGAAIMGRLRFWLRTLANLVSGLREGDYSFRVRSVRNDDVWGELIDEINLLADHLRHSRLDVRETAGLLRNVMAEIPVGVFTFDPARKLRFVNSAGERILEQDGRFVIGLDADRLGLGNCLEGSPERIMELGFGSTLGRWSMRRATVRQEGLPFQLVVLSDLSRTLREEERLAWQRIVRVLGHEVNNSLAPIQSITASLEKLLASKPSDDWEADCGEGLAIIRGRAESLSRFMRSFARLARLPSPVLREIDVPDCIRKNAALETRMNVAVVDGPDAIVRADRDQLDQLLINLIRNAADAAMQDGAAAETSSPAVEVSWTVDDQFLVVNVIDNGPGVESSENLFVPFFTTKSGGSGIGLALCRQIAEGHDGTLNLANSVGSGGAVATLRLPLNRPLRSVETPNDR